MYLTTRAVCHQGSIATPIAARVSTRVSLGAAGSLGTTMVSETHVNELRRLHPWGRGLQPRNPAS